MRALVLSVVVAGLASCVAYNEQCTPLVDDPNERVSFVAKGTEIWLDRPNARHTNNAIGQQAADAFVWVFSTTDRPVDFAVVNGGSIRADGLCVTHNIVREGPLSNGLLHDIMLFENLVNAVDLSEQEVLDMFEHSAAPLFASPAPITLPSGSFLQVSSDVALEIDCSRPANDRVVSLRIKGQPVAKPARPFPTVKYRVAMSSFVLGGGDGYSMLAGKGADPARNALQAQRFGGIDSNITTAYLKQSPYNTAVESGFRVDANRIKLTNCSVPGRPAN